MNGSEPNKAQELTDDQLQQVAGGRQYHSFRGKYYKYTGGGRNDSWDSNWDKCYLCPNCGRPVHYGSWARYYCDPCDESWYWETKLDLNLSSGLWQEISESEYKDGKPYLDWAPSR